MKGSTINVVIVLTILHWSCMTLSLPTTSRDVSLKLQFNYIGGADGKSFFAENITRLTWPEAKQYCINSGMHLLSLTSTAQLNVLENAPNTTFSGSYWTGGRDARTHAQFVWDFNETAVTSAAGTIGSAQSIQTCISYVATPSHMHIHSELCTGKLGVLCEIAT